MLTQDRKSQLVAEFAEKFNISHAIALAYLVSEEWDYFDACHFYKADHGLLKKKA